MVRLQAPGPSCDFDKKQRVTPPRATNAALHGYYFSDYSHAGEKRKAVRRNYIVNGKMTEDCQFGPIRGIPGKFWIMTFMSSD